MFLRYVILLFRFATVHSFAFPEKNNRIPVTIPVTLVSHLTTKFGGFRRIPAIPGKRMKNFGDA